MITPGKQHQIRLARRLKEPADFLGVERCAPTDREMKTGVRRDEILVFRQHATADNDRFFIGTALILILLIKFLQLRSRLSWSLSRLVALSRQPLFVYRDLWRWIDHPFEGPPQPVADRAKQLAICW